MGFHTYLLNILMKFRERSNCPDEGQILPAEKNKSGLLTENMCFSLNGINKTF